MLKDNVIEIYIDAPNHILIVDCVELSRYVEGCLDREKDDFELQVSSPGATEAFKVVPQYKKYVGKRKNDQKIHFPFDILFILYRISSV